MANLTSIRFKKITTLNKQARQTLNSFLPRSGIKLKSIETAFSTKQEYPTKAFTKLDHPEIALS